MYSQVKRMITCCLDISRGTAYGLSISQLLFAGACIMFSPHKEVTLYTLTTPTNTTNLQTHDTQVHIQALFGGLSFLAFFFSAQTIAHTENESLVQDYNMDAIEQNMMWDMMFWMYVLGAHLLSIAIVLNVCDVYLLLLACLVIQYCLYRACLPRRHEANITQENVYLLGYISSILLVSYNAQQPGLILWIVFVDYCLGVGHSWDKQATMDTIINCRLFYICCQSIMLCIYYLWKW